MKKTLQFLVWIGTAYMIYKQMYPDGLPIYQIEPNHRTDKTTKNSPIPVNPNNLKITTRTTLKKSSKKQP